MPALLVDSLSTSNLTLVCPAFSGCQDTNSLQIFVTPFGSSYLIFCLKTSDAARRIIEQAFPECGVPSEVGCGGDAPILYQYVVQNSTFSPEGIRAHIMEGAK